MKKHTGRCSGSGRPSRCRHATQKGYGGSILCTDSQRFNVGYLQFKLFSIFIGGTVIIINFQQSRPQRRHVSSSVSFSLLTSCRRSSDEAKRGAYANGKQNQ